MIKAVFLDIDGTILSHNTGKVSEKTNKAVKMLREKGILVFAATGRHNLELAELPVNHLEFDGYITLNGQLFLDKNKKLIYENPIDAKDAKKLLEIFEEKKLPVMIVEQDRMYINFVNDAVRRAQQAISTPVPEEGSYEGRTIYQFIVYDGGKGADELAETLDHIRLIRWNQEAVDLIPVNGGKVAGIQKCLNDYQINREEIIAFGDGENDIDMLTYAGIGVAMGNGSQEVKKAGDYVTDTVDFDGVWKALKHFGLL